MTTNSVMFSKGRKQLKGALELLKDTDAANVDAKTLEDAATLALTSVRILLRLAGRLDVPRPEHTTRPEPIKKKRPKPASPVETKSPAASARRGDSVYSVSHEEESSDTKVRVKKSSLLPKKKHKRK